MTLGPITPILRIFDEAKAREFYVGFLGFTEHAPWGDRLLTVLDPFGNRPVFFTRKS